MCFSPEADVTAGVVLGALAIDAFRQRPAPRDLALAALPAVLAVHSLIEAFVWWAGRGQISHDAGVVATYAYVFIAFALLPTLLPVAILMREDDPRRRQALSVLLALGFVVSAVMVFAIVDGPLTATLEHHYISYHADLPVPGLLTGGYVLATCGAGLLSSSRTVFCFAVANVVVVAVLAWVMTQALTSLWCGWAAVTSVAIVLMLRRSARERRMLSTQPR